jgi:hypothetical protein
MVGRSDELDSEGNALLDLAEVLILADRQEEATGRPGEALEFESPKPFPAKFCGRGRKTPGRGKMEPSRDVELSRL